MAATIVFGLSNWLLLAQALLGGAAMMSVRRTVELSLPSDDMRGRVERPT